MSDRLYDINAVCNMLGTTSRTLRFYEEKQIISSTIVFDSPRRQYTAEQIDHIRNVLVLRSLGLSINDIRDLQKQNTDLRSVIELNKAKIYALIAEKVRTLNLLNEALLTIESGGDVFNTTEKSSVPAEKTKEIVKICTKAIIEGDEDTLYGFLSEKLKAYMPKQAFVKVREDTIKPLGDYVSIENLYFDNDYPNVIYQRVRYEKLGLRIKYVFCLDRIVGLWFSYYKD
ncbi:MAG: MerR family transcriptional regulator [Clostridia bacterium]|nr:MerR family transcriptional regulator [Clostridia bacterium]